MNSMTILQAIVLGAVQGLTEFLPVSSSGHLIIFPHLFGWEQQSLTFDVGIHVASLAAIAVGMRSEISTVLTGVRKRDVAWLRFVLKIVVATLPAVIAAVLFQDWFEGFRTVRATAISLIIWGVVLGVADAYARRRQEGELRSIGWGQALLVGVMQIFSFLPGTSRSGSTMSAGLLSGLDRTTAARFSFLLAVPAIAGAGLLTAFDVVEQGLDVPLAPLIAGALASFVCSVAAIKLLFFVSKKANFLYFSGYRIALGLALLLFFA